MKKQKLTSLETQLAIQFSETIIDPAVWIRKGEELVVAASVLEMQVETYWSSVKLEGSRVVVTERHPNVQAVYFMLIAYAMENYFKALIVHAHHEELRSRMLTDVPNYVKGHDLMALARAVGLSLDVNEDELLYRLSENAIWKARYPVPLGSDELTAFQQLSDGRTYFTAYFGPRDVLRIHAFLDRLRAKCEDASRAKSIGGRTGRPLAADDHPQSR